jgi:membrane-bound lytic murein transglycosylase
MILRRLCCLVLLMAATACAPVQREVTPPLPAGPQPEHAFNLGEVRFVQVQADRIPALTSLSREGLKRAANANRTFLEAALIKQTGAMERAFLARLLKANLTLEALIEQPDCDDITVFNQKLHRQFVFYAPEDTTGLKDAPKDAASVLVTGYFQPELSASEVRTQEYTYPLYATPSNLLQADLQDFDKTLPARTIFGRVVGNRLTPYYTRAEIEQGALPVNTPVLAWLASPVEGLMLHIQGSGILVFPNGERRFVHYAANNGHSYRSVGKWLVEQGILPLEQVSWQSIEAWAKANPERFLQASFTNPRYIFFRFEKDGPLGVTGRRLEPMHSIALDRDIYGLGGLFLLCIDGFNGGQPFASLVFHQDVGSAIQGPHRVDLYVGEGHEAGNMAGRLKNTGRLFLLLPQDGPND